MTRLQKLTRHVTGALLALGLLAATTPAHASLKVCNFHPSELIWYTQIITDIPNCQGKGGAKEVGWWKIPRGTCQIISNLSMTGKTIQTYAITNSGSFEWPGQPQNTFLTPNTTPHENCFTTAQNLCNSGGDCSFRTYSKVTSNSPTVTINYNF